MYVQVTPRSTEPPRCVLHESDDVGSLAVRAPADSSEVLAAVLAEEQVGVVMPDRAHVGISISWLRGRAGRGDASARFESMLTYAREAGWVNDDADLVRAHIEWS